MRYSSHYLVHILLKASHVHSGKPRLVSEAFSDSTFSAELRILPPSTDCLGKKCPYYVCVLIPVITLCLSGHGFNIS